MRFYFPFGWKSPKNKSNSLMNYYDESDVFQMNTRPVVNTQEYVLKTNYLQIHFKYLTLNSFNVTVCEPIFRLFLFFFVENY